jgi:hypothetical protein
MRSGGNGSEAATKSADITQLRAIEKLSRRCFSSLLGSGSNTNDRNQAESHGQGLTYLQLPIKGAQKHLANETKFIVHT